MIRQRFRRICFVMPFHIQEMRGGGAEVQAWLLAKELARRGHEVSYLAMSVKDKGGTTERIDGVDVAWIRYRDHLRWLSSGAWYRALKQIDPDLIIQRMTSDVTGPVGLYARRYGKPFAWVCTGDEVPRRWLFLKRQMRVNRDRSPGALKGLVFLADAAVRDVLRHVGMRYVTHPFTQNERQRGDLQRSFGVNSSRIISGHEPPRDPVPAEARRLGGVVLWVGTLGKHKRPLEFAKLAQLGHCHPLRFVMIGGHADQEWTRSVRKQMPSNVEWLGPRPFDETLGWFDQAAVYVNTAAPKGEGFPNTFVQAWLRGVPVVSLGVDPDRIVTNNRLGYAVNTAEEMSAVLTALLGDATAYGELSRHVATYANERYTVERVADRFLQTLGEPQPTDYESAALTD